MTYMKILAVFFVLMVQIFGSDLVTTISNYSNLPLAPIDKKDPIIPLIDKLYMANGLLPPAYGFIKTSQDIGVELARQIAKRRLPGRHPVDVLKRVDALGKGMRGVGALSRHDPRRRAVDPVRAQMDAIADDQDQGGFADRPVPVGKEGGAAARMRDLRRDARGSEAKKGHGIYL